jgi:hypothetical protein
MEIDFAVVQTIISVVAVAVVPALTWLIKSAIRDSQQQTTAQIYRLELKIAEQMGVSATSQAQSVQIHRDMERRMTAIEDFHKNINSRLDIFQNHFKALLRKPSAGEAGD